MLIRRRTFLLSGLLGASLGARVGATSPDRLVVHDLMAEFWRELDSLHAATIEMTSSQLIARFFDRHFDLYRAAGFDAVSTVVIAPWLKATLANRRTIIRAYQRLIATLPAVRREYAEQIPRFAGSASPIYIMPTLSRFDGHMGHVGTIRPLFIGPDTIPDFHAPDASLAPFVAHELFHCFQAQSGALLFTADEEAPLHELLWAEGAATYAGQRLFPGSTLIDILISPGLLNVPPEVTRRAAAVLLRQIDSRDPKDKLVFFSADYRGEWPARIGYKIGLEIIRRAWVGRTLDALGRVAERDARTLLTAGLRQAIA